MTERPWSQNSLVVRFTGAGSMSPKRASAKVDPDRAELATAREWARDLLGELAVLGDKHGESAMSIEGATSAGETSQTLLAAIVGRVVRALAELQGAGQNSGVGVLHGLQGALADLHLGNKPSMLQPREGIGVGRDGFSRAFVKQHALLCVAVLCSAGQTAAAARSLVAKLLTETGHKGRQGGAISKKTLWDWDRDADDRAKAFVARNMARIEVDQTALANAAVAEAWVRNILTAPMMTMKI